MILPDNPQGIDVSYWQDYSPHLAGLSFAFARATVGLSVDGTYGMHRRDIRKAGIILGAYHYLVYGPSGPRQAALFYSTVADANILALDVESTALKYPTVAMSFLTTLRRLDHGHRKILLYSSDGTWPGNIGQDANWVANYSKEPIRNWRFWQYSGTNLDKDVFNGTLHELHTFAGVK
jgi:GH25 family lysozyme M1 (1,4-beta-N-acetylmuramidase)